MTNKIKISSIKPNPDNPRIVKDDKFYKLVESIKQFGEKMFPLRPIVVDENNIILGGNMRYKALKHLKYITIPDTWIKQTTNLTDDEKKEFIIKDNVGFGLWDWDLLSSDWDADLLDSWGMDIPEFEFQEIEAQEDNYEEPEQIQVDVVHGDLIEFVCQDGRVHRLVCGDSTCIDTVEKLMKGIKPDLIHTDPPYGMNAVSKSGVLSKNYTSDIIGDDNNETAKKSFNLIFSLYKESFQVWWGANYYSSILPDSECWLVWDKNNGQSDQTDCEVAWTNFRSVIRQFTKASEKTNRVHPTQKPIDLFNWVYYKFNLKIETVADFFGGSGMSLIASHQLKLTCFLMEFDPYYCQIIIDRMRKFDSNIKVKINKKEYKTEEVFF